MNYPNAPIHPDDRLGADLRIDQGDTDDLFEMSHEWAGKTVATAGEADSTPPATVRELMTEVLRCGYEGYVSVLRSHGRGSAA